MIRYLSSRLCASYLCLFCFSRHTALFISPEGKERKSIGILWKIGVTVRYRARVYTSVRGDVMGPRAKY